MKFNNVIYNSMSNKEIRGIINRGPFIFQHREFSLGKGNQCHNLSEHKNGKSKVVLKIYPEERLYLTILKHIGFDLSMLEKHPVDTPEGPLAFKKETPPPLLSAATKQPPPPLNDRLAEKDFRMRKRKMYSVFENEYGITKLDIVCYLKKSDYAIDEKDLTLLKKIYKDLKEGEPPEKLFPTINRSVKNYRWNTNEYSNFKMETKRVAGYPLDIVGDLKLRQVEIFVASLIIVAFVVLLLLGVL